MTAWVWPTARTITWTPLAGVAGFLAAIAACVALVGAWPVGLLGLTAAAVAAAVVAGTRDQAAALLAALPTSVAVRRARRLALLLPAGLAVWVAWIGVGHRWVPGLGWPLAGLVALTATGLAVSVWAPPSLGPAAGAAVPLAWVITAWVGGFAWEREPEIVTVAAAVALWVGRNR